SRDWSSDVCSSDLFPMPVTPPLRHGRFQSFTPLASKITNTSAFGAGPHQGSRAVGWLSKPLQRPWKVGAALFQPRFPTSACRPRPCFDTDANTVHVNS